MDDAFKEEINSGDYGIYMDDILVATDGTFEHHIEHVHHILDKIKDNCHRRGLAPTGPTGRTRWEERCTCAGRWTGSTLSIHLIPPRNRLPYWALKANSSDS